MHHLKESIRKTFHHIHQHKLWFSLLVLLQLMAIIGIFFLAVTYPVKILEDVNGIMQPLQAANYNVTNIQEGGAFSTDMLKVYQNYNALVKHVTEVILWLLGTFIILEGALWVGTHKLVLSEKKEPRQSSSFVKHLKEAGLLWLKYITVSLIFLGIPVLIGYFSLNLISSEPNEDLLMSIAKYTLALLGVLIYLLWCGLAVINSSWKALAKNWWAVSLKKIHWTLLALVISIIIMGSLFSLIYLTMNYEPLQWLMMLLSILCIPTLTILRILWVAHAQELISNEKDISLDNTRKITRW
ncbi:hypothetical protein HZC30_05315 [Candidatus Woesearchaeota archaeon]|nr:hypothetical protein [Candidatus Woesearchaeota archaeon]